MNTSPQKLHLSTPQPHLFNKPLNQLLQEPPNIHIYALALSKSRHENLTQQLACILEMLVIREGQKWLEIVRRLIGNCYQVGFQVVWGCDLFMQPLVAQLYMYKSNPSTTNTNTNNINSNFLQYSTKLKQKCFQYIKNFTTYQQPQAKSQILKNLQYYIETIIKNKDMAIIKQFFILFTAQAYQIRDMLRPIYDIKQYANMNMNLNKNNTNINVNEQQQQTDSNTTVLWKIHTTCVKLFFNIVQIVQKMEEQAVKKLQLRNFINVMLMDSSPGDNSPSVNFKQVIEYYMNAVIVLLSTITTTNKKQQNPLQPQTQPHHLLLPNSITHIFPKKPSLLTSYYSTLCRTVTTFTNITTLQLFLTKTPNILTLLTELSLKNNIILMNNYQILDRQLIAINSQIVYNSFSDTLAGLFMEMIVKLCRDIGGFFGLYFGWLRKVCQEQQYNKYSSQQFIDYLIKISLLSNSNILQSRKQEIQGFLEKFTVKLGENWANYDQWQQVQILRFFLVFVGKGENRGLGVGSSAEELIVKCINLCVRCLEPNCHQKMDLQYNNSHINNNNTQLTPLQQQCYNILQTLPEQPNTLRLIKQSLLPTLISLFTNLPATQNFINLFHIYLKNIPELVSRSSQTIVEYFYQVFRKQLGMYEKMGDNSMKQIKYTGKMSKLFQIFITILQSQTQLSIDLIQQKIIQPILSTISDPKMTNYEQQQLELLEILLLKHSHFTPSVCIIMSKLPRIYENNQKKLSILRNIYKAISISNEIRKQILYQYSDLMVIMLNMAVDYFENVLRLEEWMFYTDQCRELMWAVQIFIQKYASRIVEDQQILNLIGVRMFNGICKALQQTKNIFLNCDYKNISEISSQKIQFYQILIQYLMTICHICLTPTANNFNQIIYTTTINILKNSPIQFFIYLQTAKMIPVIFIDQLLLNSSNHQYVLTDIVRFCQNMKKLEISVGMNREWRNILMVQEWDEWPRKTKDYLQNVLRELRNRREIDQVDHVQYLEAINKVLI